MQIPRKTLATALLGFLTLSGCALPEGAVKVGALKVNVEISNSLRNQQVEMEKALKWAFNPYYKKLSEMRQAVFQQVIQNENCKKAKLVWHKREVNKVWMGMKSGNITAPIGTQKIENLKKQSPKCNEITSLVKQSLLSSEDITNLMKAVDAKYKFAKEQLDTELNKVISQLRNNTTNIIAANDKITQALENQMDNWLKAEEVAKIILRNTPLQLPGANILQKSIEQFAKSGGQPAQ